MKIKHVIMTLGLAAVLGLGVGVGLKAGQVKEAKATVLHSGTVYVDTYANYNYNTSNNWETGSAKFAVCYTDDTTTTWTSFMTSVTGVTHLYSASYSLTFNPTKVIAVRFNSSKESPDWDSFENQTPDLNFYENEIIQIQDDNSSWGFVDGADNWYVKGSMGTTGWTADPAYKLNLRRNDSGKIDFYSTTIEFEEGDEFKVSNVSYDSFYGYDTLREYGGLSAKEKGHVSGKDASNITVVVGGTYEVYADTHEAKQIWVQIDSQSEIEDFSSRFLTAMRANAVCGNTEERHNDNNKAGIDTVWSTWKDEFEGSLTDGAKEKFLTTNANKDVSDAAKLYKQIVTRYGESYKWDDVPTSSNVVVNPINNDSNDSMTIAIVAVSAISLIAIGSFFFVRKRKESK